jgi:hypothetical protein
MPEGEFNDFVSGVPHPIGELLVRLKSQPQPVSEESVDEAILSALVEVWQEDLRDIVESELRRIAVEVAQAPAQSEPDATMAK